MADVMPAAAPVESWDPSMPEGASGLVAPGQEEMAQEFLASPEPEEQPAELIGGKFQTQEDLLKAYQELERRQSQPQEAPTPEPASYTAEQAVETYGEAIVNQVKEAGLDMADLMWKADNGGDISEHYDALAQAIGVPKNVVENYVSKAQATEAAEPVGMSQADEAQLINMVGGQESFNQLSAWAKSNLDAQELADYNAVVDSGNKQATMWALKALQAKAAGPGTAEPKLIRGQAPVAEPRAFKSQSEVLEAMNKRDSKGRRLYDVDSEYQRKFAELLANSDVF